MSLSPTYNFDGAIAAANSLLSTQGYGIKDYPSNWSGLISAILSLNINQSNVGITIPQWLPIRDENGVVTGDSFDPPPSNGTLWFDTRQGKLMVWVNDGFYQTNGTDRYSAVGPTPPDNPVIGQTFYDTDSLSYYIFDGSLWVELVAIVGGGAGGGSGDSSAAILDLQRQIDELNITPAEILSLTNQVTAVATDITQLTQSTNAEVTSINAKTAELEAQITTQAGNVSTNATDITGLTTRVTTTETDIATNASDISTLQGNITTIEASITSVNSQIVAMNQTMAASSAEMDALRKIYYGDTSPTAPGGINNGDIWVDTNELRILVRHQGAWFNPDRNAQENEGGARVFYQVDMPTTDLDNGDLWFDSANLRLLVYSNSAFVNPNRSDGSFSALIVDALNTSSDFAGFKAYINANS